MISKKILVPVLAVATSGAVLLGGGFILAHAQTTGTPFSGLAQALASKFNLNQSDVQSAITAYMQQQKANWQQNLQQREKKRLDNLVSQGKITSAQETAIINELTTLKTQFNPSSLKGMTLQQRQQAFQNEKNTVTQWANSQNPPINPTYILPFGMGRRGMWHPSASSGSATPTPTP